MDHINNKFGNGSSCWNLENMAMEGPSSHDMELHNMIQQAHTIPMWPSSSFPLHLSSSSSSVPLPEPTPWSSLLPTSTTSSHDRDLDQYQEGHLVMNDNNTQDQDEEEEEELGAMKEMMYKIAAMQPVDIDPATIRKPKRRNVRISDDPQSVAARHRRERISEKIRILQRLVPGGTKMDTASMLDEAIRYVKFLKRQIRHLQSNPPSSICNIVGPSSSSAAAVRLGFGPLAHNQTLSFNHEVIND